MSLLHPLAVVALLATLVCIFAFQADNITTRFFHIVLIAIPILIQVYFNSALAYGLMKWMKVPHNVAAPGALIGASNFFELAVAAESHTTPFPNPLLERPLLARGLQSVRYGTLNRGPERECRPRTGHKALSPRGELSTGGVP